MRPDPADSPHAAALRRSLLPSRAVPHVRALLELGLAVAILLLYAPIAAQQFPHSGPHREHAALRLLPSTEAPLTKPAARSASGLTHAVFGYHPYWMPESTLEGYRFDLLSHAAYFACEVDPASGEPADLHGWMHTALVDSMHAHAGKALLAVTCFGAAETRTLLRSASSRDTLIARLVELVSLRGADGVNIDFEAVPADVRDELTAFFVDLERRFETAIPGALVTAAVPAVDWSGAWDFPALSDVIDLFFVMGYDYYWSGSTRAGPVAPLASGSLNVTATIDWYFGQGVPPGRLLLGVPYYGYDWPVTSEAEQAETTGRGTARTYAVALSMATQAGRRWSPTHLAPWFPYQSTAWRQVWYDDEQSLEYKYALVKDRGLAGAGIWALGYDAGRGELWDLLARSFTVPVRTETTPAPAVCGLEIYPQPVSGTHGTLHLHLRAEAGTRASLTLLDLLGRIRGSWQVTTGPGGSRQLQLPLRGLSAGPYLLCVDGDLPPLRRVLTVF